MAALRAVLIVAIYVVVTAGSLAAFYSATRSLAVEVAATYAQQFAEQQRSVIKARIDRELVLAQKLADSPLIVDWSRAENDPRRRQLALTELESYRRLFTDHSWFVALEPDRHYYYNDAQDQFRGKELRHTLRADDLSNHWYFATLANVTDYGLHVDHSEKLGVTKLWFNVVLFDGQKKVGVAGGGLDLTDFLKSVVKPPRPGVMTILVDRYGSIQGHQDESLMGATANQYDEGSRSTIFDLVAPSDRPALQKLLDRQADTGVESFELRYQGQPMAGAAVSLPRLEWTVLVLADPARLTPPSLFLPLLGVLLGSQLALLLLGYFAKSAKAAR